MVAKRREELSQSAGGSRRKEDLCIREKWALSDSAQFGVVLRLFEQDISELKEVTEKQREELRDLGKSMIKGECPRYTGRQNSDVVSSWHKEGGNCPFQ